MLIYAGIEGEYTNMALIIAYIPQSLVKIRLLLRKLGRKTQLVSEYWLTDSVLRTNSGLKANTQADWSWYFLSFFFFFNVVYTVFNQKYTSDGQHIHSVWYH